MPLPWISGRKRGAVVGACLVLVGTAGCAAPWASSSPAPTTEASPCPVRSEPSAGSDATTAPGEATERNGHSATLLLNGLVLVTGGVNGHASKSPLASTELFDPIRGTWTPTGSMVGPRAGHTATLLADGTVLVVGGSDGADGLASAERYDPESGTWMPAGRMTQWREWGHSATLLVDGRVLVTGGIASGLIDPSTLTFYHLASAELYDPILGTWKRAPNMAHPRSGHTATRLIDGSVLIVGGVAGSYRTTLSDRTTEIFEPRSQTWTEGASMATERAFHAATLLADGSALVVGGDGGFGPESAERYDPVQQAWIAAGKLIEPERHNSALVMLRDGSVLAIGGSSNVVDALASVERFDLVTKAWVLVGELADGRDGASATLLSSGRVLVVGGYDLLDCPPAPVELFDPDVPS